HKRFRIAAKKFVSSIASRSLPIDRPPCFQRIEAAHLFGGDAGAERQVLAVLLDERLALAAQHEADELIELRVEGLAGLGLHPKRLLTPERVRPLTLAVHGERNVGPAGILCDGEHLHRLRQTLVKTDVSDAARIVSYVVNDLVGLEVRGAVRALIVAE